MPDGIGSGLVRGIGTVVDDGPADSGEFVGQGRDSDIGALASLYTSGPQYEVIVGSVASTQGGPCAMTQKLTMIGIASLGDSEESYFSAGSVLFRDQSEIGRIVSSVPEILRTQGQGGEDIQGPEPGNGVQSPCDRMGEDQLLYLLINYPEIVFRQFEFPDHRADQVPNGLWQGIGVEVPDLMKSYGQDDAVFGEKPANLIGTGGALVDPALSNPQCGLKGELLG